MDWSPSPAAIRAFPECSWAWRPIHRSIRSEEHTSELQSQSNLVCRLLLEKKKKINVYDLTWMLPIIESVQPSIHLVFAAPFSALVQHVCIEGLVDDSGEIMPFDVRCDVDR